ncbi:hypothetical protein [Rhizobium leguminosarum]
MATVRLLVVFGIGVFVGVIGWSSLMVAAAQGPGRFAVIELNGGEAHSLEHSLNAAIRSDQRLIAVTSDGGETFAIVER